MIVPLSLGDSGASPCSFGHTAYAVRVTTHPSFMEKFGSLILGFVLLALFVLMAPSAAYATADAGPTTAPDCAVSPDIAAADTGARTRAIAQESTINDEILRKVDAASHVMNACVGRLIELVQQIHQRIEQIASGFYPILVAAIAIVVSEIVFQVLEQIIDNLVNAVCSAADQVYNFIDSAVKNLMCIPSGGGFDPFNFDINLNALQCDGWSVDLLTGDVYGSPVEGLNVNLNNLGSQASQAASDYNYNQYLRQYPAGAPLGPQANPQSPTQLPDESLDYGPDNGMDALIGRPVGPRGGGE
ncbi:MAG: hypothetical protein AB7G06_01925 [Bdellovibrionales bacterium]